MNRHRGRRGSAAPLRWSPIALGSLLLLVGLVLLQARSLRAGDRETPPPPARPVAARPNIVVIVADDLGWADVGLRGSAIRTPHIDQLAEQGVRLDRFYTEPWCSPTRSSLLRGGRPGRYAYEVPADGSPSDVGIDPNDYTLAERFRDAGYATALIGKWHQGNRPESHPNVNGFDYFYGLLGGYVGYDNKVGFGGVHDWQRNGKRVYNHRHATYLLGEDAARSVVERDRSRPFFLLLSFNAPHFPQQAPERLVEEYRNTTDCGTARVRCTFMAQVDILDQEIGRLLSTLEAEGIRENTLIVFFSDNGGSEAFGGSNLPLRGGKNQLFEGGIRVVALANWPAGLEGGRVSNQRMSVADVYATLEGAAGLPVLASTQSSTNLWPALAGHQEIRQRPFLFSIHGPDPEAHERPSRAILTDPWKLVVNDAEDPGDPAELLLFDVIEDPHEERDLASEHPALVQELRQTLERLEKTG